MLSKKQWMVASGVATISLITGAAAGYLSHDEPVTTKTVQPAPLPSGASENSPPRVPLSAPGKNNSHGSRSPKNNAFRRISTDNAGSLNGRMRGYLQVILTAEESELPQLMIDALREFEPDGIFANSLIPVIADRWVEADPEGAFREFYEGRLTNVSLPEEDPFSDTSGDAGALFGQIMDRALELDPDAVRDAVLERPYQPNAINVIREIARVDSHSDIAGAFDFIDLLPNPDFRRDALGAILDPTPDDFRPLSIDETRTILNRYPDLMMSQLLTGNAFNSLAAADHESALALAEEIPLGVTRTVAMKRVFQYWGASDLDSAMTYLESISSPSQQSELYRAIFRNHQKRDPSGAAKKALSVTQRNLRSSILPDATQNWYDADPAAALEWMESSLSAGEKEKATERIVEKESNPAESASLAARLPAESKAVANFIRNWFGKDPQGASNWISTRPLDQQAILRGHFDEQKDPFGP